MISNGIDTFSENDLRKIFVLKEVCTKISRDHLKKKKKLETDILTICFNEITQNVSTHTHIYL